MAIDEVQQISPGTHRAGWMQHPTIRRITLALVALVATMGMAVAGPGAASAAPVVPQSPVVISADMPMVPLGNDWAAQTARFAGCLGGFGVAAGPIVVGFMFGGPGGAVNAAKAWFPKLGPVGTNTLKWCMRSVLGVRV
jgi:hypothetical protein